MNWLIEKAKIIEQPFQSDTPVIGGLLVRLRTAWNNVAARWYVQGLFRQQNEFNGLMAQLLIEQEKRLVAQDEEIVALTKTVAELEAQLKQVKVERGR